MDETSPQPGAAREPPGVKGGIFGSPVRAFVFIFLLAFVIRAGLLVMLAMHEDNFYRLRGETGKVAASLLRTGEYANPYLIPTGPTAHPTPLWPAILYLVYDAFGITAAAGYVRGLVAICSYSALFGLMPWFGRRLGLGTGAGLAAGIAGALVPQQGLDEAIGQGVAAHAALAVGLLAVAFLRRWAAERVSVVGSLLLGMGCGAAFHVSPPLLMVVAGFLLFELCWRRGRRKWLLAACVAAGAMVACTPWTLRNYSAFHRFLFIRGNLGLELRIANHSGADPDIEVTLARQGTLRHPSENLEEAKKVRDLGEAEYMRQAKAEALDWMRAHPAEFLWLTLQRALHFWCGPLRIPWRAALTTAVTVLAFLGLRRALPGLTRPGQAALLIPLATFPLVYYFVSYVAHYPAPLAWILLLLAAYEVRHRFKAG